MGKSIIVTGATGTAGIEAVNQALQDKDIDKVTALVRRPLSINHPKLNVVVHKDFMDYSALTELFKQHDACLWCLGISQTLVTKEEYIKLTYDYTLAAAQAMLKANPNFTFVFLSGMGADNKEKSMTLFARVKGKTENALKKLPLKKLYIARPGGILPSTPRDNYQFKEKVSIRIATIMSYVLPNMSITSAKLGQAMIKMVKTEPELQTFENKDLLRFVQA